MKHVVVVEFEVEAPDQGSAILRVGTFLAPAHQAGQTPGPMKIRAETTFDPHAIAPPPRI